MGTIKVHEFTTLDGVIGAPMWTMDYEFTDEMGASIGALTDHGSGAILLGRTTWQEMGPAWSSRTTADDPGVTFFNETAKYVVSGTLEQAEGWNNSSILGGYDPKRIQEFTDSVDGGIYVSGSGTLVRAMLADGLVDELHLYVYPVAVGEGPRLFPDGGPRTTMTLSAAEGFGNGRRAPGLHAGLIERVAVQVGQAAGRAALEPGADADGAFVGRDDRQPGPPLPRPESGVLAGTVRGEAPTARWASARTPRWAP